MSSVAVGLPEIIAGLIVIALNAYALTGGADFGGGVWELLARGPRREAQRALVAHALAPIWEANHVWLILVVVMLFTAFPDVFATLGTILHIPLSLLLIGIVLRGSAFVFRSYDPRDDDVRRRWGRLFAGASILTPALLGIVVGAIASGAVGDAARRLSAVHAGSASSEGFVSIYVRPWLAPFPLITGALALTMFALLAAVYLAVAATDEALRDDFRRRALAAEAAALIVAAAGLVAARAYAPHLRGSPLGGGWWDALQIATAAAALACVAALWTRRWQLARSAAGAQVSLILWGWVVAQYPWIIPETHDIRSASAPAITLKLLLAAVAVGATILLPSLGYLYRTFARTNAAPRDTSIVRPEPSRLRGHDSRLTIHVSRFTIHVSPVVLTHSVAPMISSVVSIRRAFAAVAVAALAVLIVRAPAFAQQSGGPAVGAAALSPFQRQAREVYQQLVETNTVDSVGSVTAAAEALAQRFLRAGFPASDVHVLVPPGKPTKGNLVVRYHGRGGAGAPKPLLLLAHLDVVAANRSDWPRDPFVLHEENGYFLGRGTSDDKAMASIFVATLLRMKAAGYVPDRDLILALTADEEGGDANGVEWLIANHRGLIDAAYALNEGGGGTLAGDRPIFHSIQAAEKVPVNFTLTAVNPGGHSSVPRPDNAIYELAEALTKVAHYQFPVALNEVTRPFFAQTARVEPNAEMAAAMRALAADSRNAAAAATLSADPRYSSMMRTSCVATRLSGGHAYNALPQKATANVNCRVVPTSSAEEVKAALARVIGDTGIVITYTVPPTGERFGAAPSAVDRELLGATTTLTKRMWGDIPIIPTMSTGATDGRFLRAAGIPTYGVSGIFSTPGETNAHGRDEKLRVKSYYDGLAFLDSLVRALSSTPRA